MKALVLKLGKVPGSGVGEGVRAVGMVKSNSARGREAVLGLGNKGS